MTPFMSSWIIPVVVQSPSPVRLFTTPWTTACQVSLSLTISQSITKFMSIQPVMPSGHLILCCFLPLPSVFPSISVFSNELAVCIRWPKYWSFSFSISVYNEYLGPWIKGPFLNQSVALEMKNSDWLPSELVGGVSSAQTTWTTLVGGSSSPKEEMQE